MELTVEAITAYSRDGEGLHRHIDPPTGGAEAGHPTSTTPSRPRQVANADRTRIVRP